MMTGRSERDSRNLRVVVVPDGDLCRATFRQVRTSPSPNVHSYSSSHTANASVASQPYSSPKSISISPDGLSVNEHSSSAGSDSPRQMWATMSTSDGVTSTSSSSSRVRVRPMSPATAAASCHDGQAVETS